LLSSLYHPLLGLAAIGLPVKNLDKMEQCLNERYLLREQLGRGASALVYRAVDLRQAQTVAVKIMTKSTGKHEASHEASTAHRMQHCGHTAKVLDQFQAQFEGKDVHCLAMPLMSNGALFERVCPDAKQPLTARDSKRWIRQLITAAQAFEAAGLVHGDIKPENCLIDENSNLILHDFGTVVPVGFKYSSRIAGTELYMAPELLSRSACHTSQDVWAIALTWYAMLFADLPWDRADKHDPNFNLYISRGALAVGPRLQLLSSKLRNLLFRMLSPCPSQRATLAEMAAFLDQDQPWFRREEQSRRRRIITSSTGSRASHDSGITCGSPEPAGCDSGRSSPDMAPSPEPLTSSKQVLFKKNGAHSETRVRTTVM